LDEALAIIDAYPKQAAFQGLIGRYKIERAREQYREDGGGYDRELVEYWMRYDDDFIVEMISPDSPHAVAASYKEGCPLHLGRLDTLQPVWGKPNTWRCAIGGEEWAPDMMVKNPTTGEMVRVDDDEGTGWFPPEGFPQRGRFCFTSSYRLYMIRKLIDEPYVKDVDFDGPRRPRGRAGRNEADATANAPVYALAWAYAVTGDQRYGDRALLILNRLADCYRFYNSQLDSHTDNRYRTYRSYIHSPNRETVYLQTLMYAYDLVFDALDDCDHVVDHFAARHGADYDGDGKATTADIKYNIEHNLLGYGWEFLYRALRENPPGNIFMSQMRCAMNMALVFRNDRIMQHVIESPRGFRSTLVGSFYRDGRNHEDSSSYSIHVNDSFLVMGDILRQYRGRDMYRDGIDTKKLFGGLLDAIARWRTDIEMCDGGRRLNYGDGGDARSRNLGDDDDPLSDSFVGHEVGLTVMRMGAHRPTRKHVLLYHSNSGYGHGHFDQLMLKVIAYGYDLAGDIGYPSNLSAPKRYHWTRNTITHPTVIVDEQPQPRGIAASAEFHADAGWAQAAAAWSTQAYPDIDLYHRTAVVVEVDDDRHFVIDLFRLRGGKQYDYAFHSLGGDDGQNFHITCNDRLADQPGTLADPGNPDAPYAADEHNGYSYIRNLRSGNVSDTFTATWRVGEGDGIGYKLHMLDAPDRRIITGLGEGRGTFGRSPLDPYLIVRDRSDVTTFVAVHEPFRGEDMGLTLEPLAVDGPHAAGVKITTANGQTYTLQSTLPQPGAQQLTLTGPRGTLAINTPDAPACSGRIVDADYANRTMTVESESDWSNLAGRIVYIEHPQYVKRTAFDIESVAPAGENRWIITTRRSALLGVNQVDRVDDDGRAWSPFTMEKLLECAQLFDGKAVTREGETIGRIVNIDAAQADGMDWHRLRLDAPLSAGDRYDIYDYAPGDTAIVPGIAVR
jgi:hypothetical protein